MFKFSKISLVLLVIPSTLICMEESVKIVTLTRTQEKAIEQLYDTAGTTMSKLKSTDDASVQNLLQFISNVNAFKTNNAGIDENYLGSFAHTKETTSSFTTPFSSTTQQPTRIALFFHQLKNYNNEISITEKTHPTLEDWQAHKYNEALPIDSSILKGVNMGIIIAKEYVKKNKEPFKPITPNTALPLFIKLITNIETLVAEKNFSVLKTLADLIYLNGAVETPQD